MKFDKMLVSFLMSSYAYSIRLYKSKELENGRRQGLRRTCECLWIKDHASLQEYKCLVTFLLIFNEVC